MWLAPLASFRRSPSFAADAGAVAVWLRIGEIRAAKLKCEPFDAARFREVLRDARGLTLWDDVGAAAYRLVELCAGTGVAVVFVGEIGKTRASGAARWLTPRKALVQLSLRHKTDDHLWFSFFHESAHVLLHSKKETFINTGSAHEATDAMEDEANQFAASQLIPRTFESELARLTTEADVEEFAHRVGVAPGIVVGRLQKEGIWAWNRGNSLKPLAGFPAPVPLSGRA